MACATAFCTGASSVPSFFRGIFVAIGTGLLALGPWVEVVFAVIVAWTAIMMLRAGDDDDEEVDYSQHMAYRFAKKLFPVWPKLHGSNFFVRRSVLEEEVKKPENAGITLAAKGALFATPLFLCLVVAEISDVLFAFDSVPAIIAVSREPLIVFSAMLFAILACVPCISCLKPSNVTWCIWRRQLSPCCSSSPSSWA